MIFEVGLTQKESALQLEASRGFSLCFKEAGKSDRILSPKKDHCFARSVPWKEHIFLLSSGHRCPKRNAPKYTPINLQVTKKRFPSILPAQNKNSQKNFQLQAETEMLKEKEKKVYKTH